MLGISIPTPELLYQNELVSQRHSIYASPVTLCVAVSRSFLANLASTVAAVVAYRSPTRPDERACHGRLTTSWVVSSGLGSISYDYILSSCTSRMLTSPWVQDSRPRQSFERVDRTDLFSHGHARIWTRRVTWLLTTDQHR